MTLMDRRLLSVLAFSLIFSMLASVLFYRLISRPAKPVEVELVAAVNELQRNSERAAKLLAELQVEVTNRARAVNEIESSLRELQRRRTLLELTDDQKRAIGTLIRRDQGVKEILTSTDFWVGRMLPSTFFFAVGVIVTLRMRRLRS